MKKIFFYSLLTAVLVLSTASTRVTNNVYIQLYSVRDVINDDFKGTVGQLAKMGYAGVEAAGYNNGQFYGMEPEAFKKEIESAGMQVLSSHLQYRLADKPEATDWNAAWKWWDQAIAAHKAAGMKYMVVPAMPFHTKLADLKAYCDYYNEIGKRCKAAGMRLGYHNHAFEFKEVEGEIMYDYMLKNTDPELVFFQMDVYWVVKGGKSPVDYFNTYPGRFVQLHLKDERELGESGMVGFDAIYRNLKIAGTEELIVEVEKYSTGKPLESVRKSRNYLKKLKY